MPNNILITGVPKSGKSTLLERVIGEIGGPKSGFLTREIRGEKERTGFEVVTSTGGRQLLASVDIRSRYRVSRYFVDVVGFEGILEPFFDLGNEALYLDEIGQMQLYSQRFGELVEAYLDADNVFIGTLSRVYEHELIDRVRRRRDVTIFDITRETHEPVFNEIKDMLRRSVTSFQLL